MKKRMKKKYYHMKKNPLHGYENILDEMELTNIVIE